MAGGPGKINEYNQSLTPEQRKANARKAAKRPRKKTKLIRDIAKIINDAPAQASARDSLAKLGIPEGDMTNAALIAAAVFRAAWEGDMRAVEKWERYVGQADEQQRHDGMLADLIDGLKEPDDQEGGAE